MLTRVLPTRRRRRSLPHPGDAGPAEMNDAMLTRRVEAAVDEGLDVIAQGPVADAIIACWLRLVDTVTSAGVALRRSDTPTETVVRVLARGGVRAASLERLADLYREARFSTHRMNEASREAARQALERIREDLVPAGAPTTSGRPAHDGGLDA